MSVSRASVIQMVSDHFQGDVYGTGFAEPRPKEAVLTFLAATGRQNLRDPKFEITNCDIKSGAFHTPRHSVRLNESTAKKPEHALIPVGSHRRKDFRPTGPPGNARPRSCGLYGVPLKRLNEQVKRNQDRFPDDFMFQLTLEDGKSVLALRSQFRELRSLVFSR